MQRSVCVPPTVQAAGAQERTDRLAEGGALEALGSDPRSGQSGTS